MNCCYADFKIYFAFNPFSAEPFVVNCYVVGKGLMGYIHVQSMLTSPAIPGLLFLTIQKSNLLFLQNYTIFTLIVPKNFQFPRNSWKSQGVGG